MAAACALGATGWLVLPAVHRAAVPAGRAFTIAGAPDRLVPGEPSPLDLTVTNPNPFPVRVTSLTVQVAARTSVPGCLGDRDFRVSPLSGRVDLPARSASTLSALGVGSGRLPTVTAPAGPGPCAAARVTLRYAGTAVPAR